MWDVIINLANVIVQRGIYYSGVGRNDAPDNKIPRLDVSGFYTYISPFNVHVKFYDYHKSLNCV